MKVIRWILSILAILFTLLMTTSTALAWLGVLTLVFGLYQVAQKRKGKITFSKPGWFIASGIIFSLIVAMFTVEPTTEPVSKDATKKINQEDKIASEEEKAKREAEEKAKKEAEEKAAAVEKAKAEEEAKKQQQEELIKALALEAVTVSRVVDGDTVELSDGRKIRLVGVNTPESTNKHEKYGEEASDYTKSKLEGQKVWIQKDVSDTDRYDRYLRIIWLSIPTDDMNESEIRSKMFNADLVINGYAEPSTYPPDVKYSDFFVKFAREARESSTGLWAYGENGTTKGDLDPKTTTTSSNSSSSSTSNNNNSTSTSTTTSSSSGRSESFKNCTEMRKVYPKGVSSDHPAYEPKHDRDKDNWACEAS